MECAPLSTRFAALQFLLTHLAVAELWYWRSHSAHRASPLGRRRAHRAVLRQHPGQDRQWNMRQSRRKRLISI